MSGPMRVRSVDFAAEQDLRPVLGPAGNKAPRKPSSKPVKKLDKLLPATESEDKKLTSLSPVAVSHPPQCASVPSILRYQQQDLSMNASWSSDASSSDLSHSQASSSGKKAGMVRRSGVAVRSKQCEMEKSKRSGGGSRLVDSSDALDGNRRCPWVTPNCDPCYAVFHDEEWGVPVHDDKKLFELLSLSGALAELAWPAILKKRNMFREVFLDFDPLAVSKLSEKKIITPGSLASSLLSELKIRAIIENARQICKIIDEFGSLDKYMWNFVNHRPIYSQFRYARQVPAKTPKAEVISKDLIRRGFRSVSPTVMYTFMQVAGLTNDHLISCFRYQECVILAESLEKDDGVKVDPENKKPEDVTELGLASAMHELNFSSK